MRRLSGFDAEMLYAETATLHMHVSALLILDPSTAPDGFGVDDWRRLMANQIVEMPPFRERLVEVPLGLDRPVWIDDPDFDLDAHIHHIAVPSPGGPRQLANLIGDLTSYKLDRGRALWEAWYIEGLGTGHVAVLSKVHHAALDGVAGSLMLGSLFDTEPKAAPPMPDLDELPEPERRPSDLELLRQAAGSMLRAPTRAIEPLKSTISSAIDLARRGRSGDLSSATMPFQGPRTSINRPITSHRSFAFTSVPLSEIKEIKAAVGVKVNDVVLALCSGALRRYLDDRGELPDAALTAAVPVSTRGADDMGTFGNMVSGMLTSLASDIDDPIERLRAIQESSSGAKELYASGVEDALIDWTEVPAPSALAMTIRFIGGLAGSDRLPPIFNLLVSNVPGPPIPLYAGGAQLVGCYPMGPLIGNVGLNVSILSYMDSTCFGFVGCPEFTPDLWKIADGVDTSLTELRKAVAALPGKG